MSEGLTARQTQILKILVDEYIDSASPVGSENLEKKYELGVSPATIRNEMALLTKSGYLKQPHTSAGRVPTPKAMKFYIDQLMEEKKMSLTEEVKAKEEVWDARTDINALLRSAAQALAVRTGSLAVAVSDEGRAWHAGYANIFAFPELMDQDVCTNLFELIEETNRLEKLFFETLGENTSVEVIFGEDLGWPGFSNISVVGTVFPVRDRKAALGIIGPTRSSYAKVIPVLRYFGNMVQDVARA